MPCRFGGPATLSLKFLDTLLEVRLTSGPAMTLSSSSLPTLNGKVFGFLRAVRDMDTFSDVLKNTRLDPWYKAMEEAVPPALLVVAKD